MRIRIWMVVVAALAVCVVWVGLFVYRAQNNDILTVYDSGGDIRPSWMTGIHQVETLLVEIGATLLAALAVGIWTARRKA